MSKTISGGISDIPLEDWRDHPDLWTDSLWLVEHEQSAKWHDRTFPGNFVPQIPQQLIKRYTRPGDWVVDAYAGSGTTLIEATLLGRRSVGVEWNADFVRNYTERVEGMTDAGMMVRANSTGPSGPDLVSRVMGDEQASLIIMHPPYHDIIQYSEDPIDLSASPTVDDYITWLVDGIEDYVKLLQSRHYLAIVIGDKYSGGTHIPLHSLLLGEITERRKSLPLQLKSIVVKNYGLTRSKRGLQNLWRYRALLGGFYVFQHEYILIYRKR